MYPPERKDKPLNPNAHGKLPGKVDPGEMPAIPILPEQLSFLSSLNESELAGYNAKQQTMAARLFPLTPIEGLPAWAVPCDAEQMQSECAQELDCERAALTQQCQTSQQQRQDKFAEQAGLIESKAAKLAASSFTTDGFPTPEFTQELCEIREHALRIANRFQKIQAWCNSFVSAWQKK